MRILEELKSKNIHIYPIKQLVKTQEKNYNLDRINSLSSLNKNLVYNSVVKCLEILDEKETKFKDIISEVLLWMDTAKTGTKEDIKEWKKLGFNLFSHNLGSAEIYKKYSINYNEIIYILIKTHGLIGQYIKGEVSLGSNKELYNLIINKLLTKEELKEILLILNECIIREVSEDIFNKEEKELNNIIEKIVNGKFEEKINIIKRFEKLNEGISDSDKEKIKTIIKYENIYKRLIQIFDFCELWYYKSALNSFSIENQIKILLIISINLDNSKEISFSSFMKSIYLDYNGLKRINIYKQRIIEKYLDELSYKDILNKKYIENIHISYEIKKYDNTLEFNFKFSKVSKKLIEFCEIAYSSGSLYNKAVILLYDLFGFRKDDYDRFYNEIDYLETMNSVLNHKRILLDFIKGKNILDVGPGGGALMDLILDTYSDKKVFGIDISSNIIDELNNKMIKENKKYNLIKGNALNINKYFKKGSLDTIIYSSIIHELYSYIEFEGKKFNHNTIITSLKNAYEILSSGGRIIIRDGIMSEDNDKRIIEFKNKDDIKILKRYKNDFKGRKIEFKQLSDNKVIMNKNDSMEFLYTYTWGEESYPMEVKEQFGYYTKKEYERMIKENLPNSKIIFSKSFLQSGYVDHLSNKINYYDENYNTAVLPDSTYIVVIEKGEA